MAEQLVDFQQGHNSMELRFPRAYRSTGPASMQHMVTVRVNIISGTRLNAVVNQFFCKVYSFPLHSETYYGPGIKLVLQDTMLQARRSWVRIPMK
jgi:hypothetical protein